MTTYALEREDTGQELTAYQVRDEAARLDGAASDTRWAPGDPWTPGPGSIPAHPERMRKPRKPHHDVPARVYAKTVGGSGLPTNRAAIRDVRLHMRVGYEHLKQQAQDWEDLAFWAHERQQVPAPQVRDVLSPLVAAYERERDAPPLPELHPARELAPDRLDADHARRVKVAQQRQHRDSLAPLAEPATQVAGETATSNETAPELQPRRRRWSRFATRVGDLLARAGGARPDEVQR